MQSRPTKFFIAKSWDKNSPNEIFGGLIDEVKIYNRALTAEEIEDSYKDSLKK